MSYGSWGRNDFDPHPHLSGEFDGAALLYNPGGLSTGHSSSPLALPNAPGKITVAKLEVCFFIIFVIMLINYMILND